MPILCSMHINCHLLDALLKNPVALKVLVWSRGRLVTLQILTSSSFSLVEETHGSSGQCVSFSLIDVGSGFTAYVVFLFFPFPRHVHYSLLYFFSLLHAACFICQKVTYTSQKKRLLFPYFLSAT